MEALASIHKAPVAGGWLHGWEWRRSAGKKNNDFWCRLISIQNKSWFCSARNQLKPGCCLKRVPGIVSWSVPWSASVSPASVCTKAFRAATPSSGPWKDLFGSSRWNLADWSIVKSEAGGTPAGRRKMGRTIPPNSAPRESKLLTGQRRG